MGVYLFPGQGSQSKGMGKDFFSAFPVLTAAADEILGYSVAELCSAGDERLNQTQYTQPALYVVNALTYYDRMEKMPQKPNYVAGHSLGEYNALLAAEVFDFTTGLQLVKKRGELMSQAKGGGMAAVLGLTAEIVQQVLEQADLKGTSIANYNSHTQIVISGPEDQIANAPSLFKKAGASLFIPLKVSGAFHSPHLQAAQQDFELFLNGFQFKAPSVPVIANVHARPYQADAIHASLAAQITSPVAWTATIEYLLSQGETEFSEIGPAAVLTGLLRRIRSGQ